MKFKTNALATEFYGDLLDARLRALFLELDLQLSRKFNKEITLTHCLRTPEQQAAFYPKNPTKPSRHLDRPCRAVDFRNADLAPVEIEFLRTHTKLWWPGADFLVNDRGTASPHIHVELNDFPNGAKPKTT